MDTPEDQRKVHDIYPDEPEVPTTAPDAGDDGEECPAGQPTEGHARKGSLSGAINYARPRPFHIPRQISQSYPAFKGK